MTTTTENLIRAIDNDTIVRAEYWFGNGVDAVEAAERALLGAGGFTSDDIEQVKQAFADTLT